MLLAVLLACPACITLLFLFCTTISIRLQGNPVWTNGLKAVPDTSVSAAGVSCPVFTASYIHMPAQPCAATTWRALTW